ncbi:BQ5605_C009g05725 [Microbotryum silenes-dioicae]|uniref:BQ5605_C009g05725 protein n=1 Tax=Microbotryum silenes-dioicae TaxID=796604 RepID=A0A2X0P9D0_9BASI|nr:BQ5605_C009g05725 [Microbotryum silenes-dioicae]
MPPLQDSRSQPLVMPTVKELSLTRRNSALAPAQVNPSTLSIFSNVAASVLTQCL